MLPLGVSGLNGTASFEFEWPLAPISTACGPSPNWPNGRSFRTSCASSTRNTFPRSRGKNTARNRLKRVESGPTGIASGRTGVRAIGSFHCERESSFTALCARPFEPPRPASSALPTAVDVKMREIRHDLPRESLNFGRCVQLRPNRSCPPAAAAVARVAR